MSTVVVVGSVNLDLVAEVDRLPSPGETLLTNGLQRHVGGKGANQAVAASVAGADTTMVARVGDDPVGEELRSGLVTYGVTVDEVTTVADTTSGLAMIALSPDDNTILVTSGANWQWDDTDLPDVVTDADVVVLQLEIPDEVLARVAKQAKGRIVLNAAPARAVADEVLSRCDPLVVNEHELALLTGSDVPDAQAALRVQQELAGPRSVVTTLGSRGAVWSGPDGSGHQPSAEVTARDSTGAGDAFVGYLAAQLADGAGLRDAVRTSTAAAGLSVQREGTHESVPSPDEVAAAVDDLPDAD